jgi:GNAT superfamily N-acetyltransferase
MCENASNLSHPTMGSATRGCAIIPAPRIVMEEGAGSHGEEALTLPSPKGRGFLNPIPAPRPRIGLSIRVGVATDFAFIDALQKKHRDEVGFMPRPQLEQYINGGSVLIAEDGCGLCAVGCEPEAQSPEPKAHSAATPLGYIIARDRYFKRDDCGIIYQLCVAAGSQRKLVGAALVQEVFRRAAYGCKLFCCWCAQDIAANRFWESIGFVPLAFRTGSKEKDRIHIFWQKRIDREEALTPALSRGERGQERALTPYWYPSQTNAGALREDRLALPIPAGVKWSDEMPRIVPEAGDQRSEVRDQVSEGRSRALPTSAPPPPTVGPSTNVKKRKRGERFRAAVTTNGMRWRQGNEAEAGTPMVAAAARPIVEKSPKPERRKAKFDPKHVALARELRDRYLEEVNSGRIQLDASRAKYDVCRRLSGPAGEAEPLIMPVRLLDAA